MEVLKKFQILHSLTVKDAVACMEDSGYGFCVCVDDSEIVIGIITDGDFRRAVLNDVNLDGKIDEIINRDFIQIGEGYGKEEVHTLFSTTFANVIPVISSQGFLKEIILKDDFFNVNSINKIKERMPYPAVIMAGGEGTRLAPFTNILPKPLLPLGDEPVIKVIMEKFNACGVDEFYVTVNSKKQMIKGYFHDHELPFTINFVDEDEPLGTAGSLGLIKKDMKTNFFVVNCDVVLDIDYNELVKFHDEGEHDLTLVASLRKYVIPYGVCNTDNKGSLVSMQEKPEQNLLVNTGLYFLNSSVLNLISGKEFLHMTDIINILKEKGFSVGVYPVTEKSWLDVGQWEEYSATLKQLGL